jgi:hypothetical protein
MSIADQPAELPPDEERRLFALVVAHQQPGRRCPACHQLRPCQQLLDARHALRMAGVDLDQAIGTIWS